MGFNIRSQIEWYSKNELGSVGEFGSLAEPKNEPGSENKYPAILQKKAQKGTFFVNKNWKACL